MPEEPEIEMEKLHEAIKEELEHEGGRFLKKIALTTALFAALGAIASLLAGATGVSLFAYTLLFFKLWS